MGMIMENILNLLQILLDAGLLFLCLERMFRNKNNPFAVTDWLLYPVVIFFCMAARVNIIAGIKAPVLFPGQGFEIAPANNFFLLLFLILAFAFMSSLYYKPEDSSYTLCGSISIFSVYLSSRVMSVIIFTLCGATGNVLLLGSRILSVVFASIFLFSPVFEWCNQIMRNGGFSGKLLSANVALVLIVVLSVFSFDIAKITEHIQMVALLLLAIFIFDSIMLIYNGRRIQEQKRVRMIEQYVPIVEELVSQVRSRQHEYNNRLIAIEAAVMSSESLEEAKQSVSLLANGIYLDDNDRELLLCDSKMIAGMLYEKIKQASLLKIDIFVELQNGFKTGILPETEWIEILGILLDNAIEASKSGDTIYVQSCKLDRYIELTVSNPFTPMSNTEFIQLFRKGFTTKGENGGRHGFGLYNVLAIMERYHGKIITRNEAKNKRNYVVFGVKI